MFKRILYPRVYNFNIKDSFFTGFFYRFFVFLLAIFCLGIASYILFYNLGYFPFENWDEAFYAEATKEMLQGKYIVLHWDYKIWLDKPPLYIWISSLVSSLIGLSELSVRLPSAVSAYAIVILTSYYVYKQYKLIPALFTFFTLILNNLFIWRARSGNLDLLVSFFILLTYFLLLSKNKYRYVLLGFVFSCIYLTKTSLVAFPFFIFLLNELFYQRQYIKQNIKEYIKLLIIFIGMSSLWLVLGYREGGDLFASYYIFHSDQGVAALSKLNINYILHVYYSLQRRFFWIFLLGMMLVIKNIKQQKYFLLFMYSSLLLIQLSFTSRDNNWYLIPSIPFWSIIIGFAIYSIMEFLKKRYVVYLSLGALVLSISTYICYKTYIVNIIPIFNLVFFSSSAAGSPCRESVENREVFT